MKRRNGSLTKPKSEDFTSPKAGLCLFHGKGAWLLQKVCVCTTAYSRVHGLIQSVISVAQYARQVVKWGFSKYWYKKDCDYLVYAVRKRRFVDKDTKYLIELNNTLFSSLIWLGHCYF